MALLQEKINEALLNMIFEVIGGDTDLEFEDIKQQMEECGLKENELKHEVNIEHYIRAYKEGYRNEMVRYIDEMGITKQQVENKLERMEGLSIDYEFAPLKVIEWAARYEGAVWARSEALFYIKENKTA
jgi:hypothetical protein